MQKKLSWVGLFSKEKEEGKEKNFPDEVWLKNSVEKMQLENDLEMQSTRKRKLFQFDWDIKRKGE